MTYDELRIGIKNGTVKEGTLIYAYVEVNHPLPFGSLQARYCIMQLKKDDVIDPFVLVFDHERGDYTISCSRQPFTISLFRNYKMNILSDDKNIPEKLLKTMDLQRIKVLSLAKSIMDESDDTPSKYHISETEKFYLIVDTKASRHGEKAFNSECIRLFKTDPVINNGYLGYMHAESSGFQKKYITEDDFKKIQSALHDSCHYILDLTIRFGTEYIKQN